MFCSVRLMVVWAGGRRKKENMGERVRKPDLAGIPSNLLQFTEFPP